MYYILRSAHLSEPPGRVPGSGVKAEEEFVWRKPDEPKPSAPGADVVVPPAPEPQRSTPAPPIEPVAPGTLSKALTIKGQITGSEDLYIDGEVEGRVEISEGRVTVGPNGRVKADIDAREIVVRGTVSGKLNGRERVEIGRTGRANGDIVTRRVSIEDGAQFRGKIEVVRAEESRAARTTVASSTQPRQPVPVSVKDALP